MEYSIDGHGRYWVGRSSSFAPERELYGHAGEGDGVLPLPPAAAASGGDHRVADYVHRLCWTNVQEPVRDALLAMAEAIEERRPTAAAAADLDSDAVAMRVAWLAKAIEDLQRRDCERQLQSEAGRAKLSIVEELLGMTARQSEVAALRAEISGLRQQQQQQQQRGGGARVQEPRGAVAAAEREDSGLSKEEVLRLVRGEIRERDRDRERGEEEQQQEREQERAALRSEVRQLRSEVAALRRQQGEAQAAAEQAGHALRLMEAVRADAAALEARAARSEAAHAARAEAMSKRLEGKAAAGDVVALSEVVDALRQEMLAMERRLAGAEAERARLAAAREASEAEVARLAVALQAMETRVEDAKGEGARLAKGLQASEERMQRAEAEAARLAAAVQAGDERMQRVEAEAARLAAALQAGEEGLQRCEARLELEGERLTAAIESWGREKQDEQQQEAPVPSPAPPPAVSLRMQEEVASLRASLEVALAEVRETREAAAHRRFHERLAAATALAAPAAPAAGRAVQGEQRTGRWLWRGELGDDGDGNSDGDAVLAWTAEACGAPAEVFAWGGRGAPTITALVPGLYVVSAAVFTAARGVVGMEVLVDGAAAVAVAEREKGEEDEGGRVVHPLGNVAARVSIVGRFLSLPAGARVSVRLVVRGGGGRHGRKRGAQAFVQLGKM